MPRRKPKHTLLSAGASLIGMVLTFLLLPAMLGTRPVIRAVGEGLRMPGWSALGVGVVLLALHGLVRQRSAVKLPEVDRRNTPHRVSPTINQVEPTLEPPARIADSPDATPAPARAHERLTRWSPEVFAAIEWRRFEAGKLGSDEDYSSHLGQQQSFLRVCPRSSLQDNAAQGDCLPRRMMRWPVYFL